MKNILKYLKPFLFCGTLLSAQQQIKQYLDKLSRGYKRLIRQCISQLNISQPQLQLNYSTIAKMPVDEILTKYRNSLRKSTVFKLEIISKLKKEKYTKDILMTICILGCGAIILPQLFVRVTFGYAFLYQFYLFERGISFAFRTHLPLSYNFESVSYFVRIFCMVGILFGFTFKGVNMLKQMRTSKSIIIRKQ